MKIRYLVEIVKMVEVGPTSPGGNCENCGNCGLQLGDDFPSAGVNSENGVNGGNRMNHD